MATSQFKTTAGMSVHLRTIVKQINASQPISPKDLNTNYFLQIPCLEPEKWRFYYDGSQEENTEFGNALHEAVMLGHVGLAKKLIELGANPIKRTEDTQHSIFHLAILYSTPKMFDALRKAAPQAYLSMRDYENALNTTYNPRTPIHLASELNRDMIVEMMLEDGFTLRLPENSTLDLNTSPPLSPIQLAVKANNVEEVKKILENPDPSLVLEKHISMLLPYALASDAHDTALLLLKHPNFVLNAAEIEKITHLSSLHTPSAEVTQWLITCIPKFVLNNNEEELFNIIRYLLKHAPEKTEEFQHLAEEALQGTEREESLKEAIKLALDNNNESLFQASEKGYIEAIKLLLDNGIPVDVANEDGVTALQWAASTGQDEAITLLLDRGANIEALDLDNSTALHCASCFGHINTVTLLIERGAKIDVIDQENATALYYAAKLGHMEIATLLLDKGANITAENNDHFTALHCAAEGGAIEMLTLLIGKGAQVDAVTNSDLTALHYAATHGHTAAAKLLIEKGASIDAKDNIGFTALHYAANMNQLETVELLIEQGADITIKNNEGQTALDTVKERADRQEVAQVLQAAENRPNHKRVSLSQPTIDPATAPEPAMDNTDTAPGQHAQRVMDARNRDAGRNMP